MSVHEQPPSTQESVLAQTEVFENLRGIMPAEHAQRFDALAEAYQANAGRTDGAITDALRGQHTSLLERAHVPVEIGQRVRIVTRGLDIAQDRVLDDVKTDYGLHPQQPKFNTESVADKRENQRRQDASTKITAAANGFTTNYRSKLQRQAETDVSDSLDAISLDDAVGEQHAQNLRAVGQQDYEDRTGKSLTDLKNALHVSKSGRIGRPIVSLMHKRGNPVRTAKDMTVDQALDTLEAQISTPLSDYGRTIIDTYARTHKLHAFTDEQKNDIIETVVGQISRDINIGRFRTQLGSYLRTTSIPVMVANREIALVEEPGLIGPRTIQQHVKDEIRQMRLQGATDKQIHRKLARKYHPDVNGELPRDASDAAMKVITEIDHNA